MSYSHFISSYLHQFQPNQTSPIRFRPQFEKAHLGNHAHWKPLTCGEMQTFHGGTVKAPLGATPLGSRCNTSKCSPSFFLFWSFFFSFFLFVLVVVKEGDKLQRSEEGEAREQRQHLGPNRCRFGPGLFLKFFIKALQNNVLFGLSFYFLNNRSLKRRCFGVVLFFKTNQNNVVVFLVFYQLKQKANLK